MSTQLDISQAPGTIPVAVAGERPSHRNGALCALFVAACVWATYPVAQMGFVDDWSYIKTAQVFAQSGHIAYNGWASPILGWEIAWGALFIKLFGFSFTIVRLSTLPLAMAAVFLFHAVLRRFGLEQRHAVFGCLCLGLSPLFVPMAASFMSDMGGLLFIVLCLYLCQRALDAETGRRAILWLAGASLASVMGGAARQIAWLGVLVMVPSTAWLLRRHRGVLAATGVLWWMGLIAVWACSHWFAAQPYSIPESGEGPNLKRLGHLAAQLIRALLCLLLVVSPLLVAWAGRLKMPKRREWLRLAGFACLVLCVALILIVAAVLLDPASTRDEMVAPWLVNLMENEGMWGKEKPMLGLQYGLCPMWLRAGVSLGVVGLAAAFTKRLLSRPWRESGTPTERTMRRWRELACLAGPFSLSYILLLSPGGIRFYLFDRYLLGLLPLAILLLLMGHQDFVARVLPRTSYIALSLLSWFAIAGTHDWFAVNRARAAMGQRLVRAGIPRTEIEGGWDYDGWTEIEHSGYVNNPRLRTPGGAFHPHPEAQTLPEDCIHLYSDFAPSITPRFAMVGAPLWCLEPTGVPPLTYVAWKPPFHRAIYVERIPAAVPRAQNR